MNKVMLLGVAALVVVGLISIGKYLFDKTNEKLEDSTKDAGYKGPGG